MTAQESPVSDNPYRPDSCKACEERKEFAKLCHPFSSITRCPECENNYQTAWGQVCTGKLNLTSPIPRKWWEKLFFIKEKQRTVHKCDTQNAPKHLHYQCTYCKTHWMMLTKSETKGKS